MRPVKHLSLPSVSIVNSQAADQDFNVLLGIVFQTATLVGWRPIAFRVGHTLVRGVGARHCATNNAAHQTLTMHMQHMTNVACFVMPGLSVF